MKEKYIRPEVEVIQFNQEDIIATSGGELLSPSDANELGGIYDNEEFSAVIQ